MIDSELLTSLVAALVAAFCGGYIAVQLRLPPIVGYLAAGIVIGANTPGFAANEEVAAELAEIGVVLLMFGVGIQFSLKDLWAVRGIAVPGAVLQVAAATALGVALATGLFGWTFGEALVMSLAVSVASTVVLLRALEARGAIDTAQGHIAVGWLIVQDVITVVVLVLLPALAGPLGGEETGGNALLEIGEAVAKAIAFVALILVAGSRLIPLLLGSVARTGSRELFTLCVLAIALGVAAGSAELFGVSLALGAFLAGVLISETDLSHQAAADALPMRDAFAVLFFVSVGMVFDPGVIDDYYLEIAIISALVIFAKAIVSFAIVSAMGYSARTALTLAAGAAQIGEFTFILMTLGLDLGIVPDYQVDIVLAAALVSILLNPVLFAFTATAENWLRQRAPRVSGGRLGGDEGLLPGPEPMRGHAVICGYGRVGSIVAKTLALRDFRYIVVEEDRRIVESLRAQGVPAIFGDAGHHLILERTNLENARVLVVTVPEPPVTRRVVEYARARNPRLDIVTRTHSAEERTVLEEAGAGEAVYGEWEVALELTRRALYRFGLSSQEALAIVQRMRSQGPPASLDDLMAG